MKKVKFLIVLLVITVVCDLALLFVDDGNHSEMVNYDATVTSCEVSKNSGLDTYYIVGYEYKDLDGNLIKGTDNYYLNEVHKGDKITVSDRVTVKGEYADLLFYITIAVNIILGVLSLILLISVVKIRKGVKS